MVEAVTGYKVVTLRTDNGGEYVSTEFESYLKYSILVSDTSALYQEHPNRTE